MKCGRGVHDIRGPLDRLPNGQCRHCDRDRQRGYRQRRRLGIALLKQMERAGLKTADLRPDSGFAIALEWVNAADDHDLARIEAEHPALIGKVRHQLERIEAGR